LAIRRKTTAKKEIKKILRKNKGFFAHSVEYIKEERKREKGGTCRAIAQREEI
jgi:hypothetical protein